MNHTFANLCQSLHLGCNDYKSLNNKLMTEVKESHNDVSKYEKIFNELLYDKVIVMKDMVIDGEAKEKAKAKEKPIPIRKKDYREEFLKATDNMLNKCAGAGKNPYTVNLITFSGHGITYGGDAIAIIP
jgi:uncharacterized protein YihD (DUF1040 family)